MDLAAILAIEFLYSISSLALISAGLAIIFGMMRVINFAHGEFLMLGAFAVLTATDLGINLWVAILVVAPAFVGLVGIVVERLLVRRLYGRIIVTLLATWGLSFFLIGLATAVFGNVSRGVTAPVGSITIGQYKTGGYTLFVIGVAIVVLVSAYAFLRFTRAGLVARGAMQNPTMAAALGIDTTRVYAITFGVGAALSGLAGAVLAPFAGVIPTMGLAYVAKAFITVISGGVAVLAGTSAAAALYGTVNQTVTFLTGPVIGEVALLGTALVLLRVMPQGITSRLFRRAM